MKIIKVHLVNKGLGEIRREESLMAESLASGFGKLLVELISNDLRRLRINDIKYELVNDDYIMNQKNDKKIIIEKLDMLNENITKILERLKNDL